MEGVSVITCTIRQDQIDNVFDNYTRQTFEPKELIIILNHDDMNVHFWKKKALPFNNVTVMRQSQNRPLGACLNYAAQRAKYSYIAKFDDDDYYSPRYLEQAVHALQTTDASIVGKDAHTTYFEDQNVLAVMRPENQNIYTSHVGGGTIVFKKSVFAHVKFPLLTKGEDIVFQKRCLQKGFKIYSTDKNGYVSIRRKNKQLHTWQAEDDELLLECEIITHTNDYKSFVE